MYTVVLIDDEPLIVEGLRKVVRWEDYHCSVVGTADDAESGAKLTRSVHPDILFTDIRMPGVDGLTMLAGLRSEFPDMLVTVLTGYRDFAYAQQAIRLGVSRFLLKPSKMDEINEALLAMSGRDIDAVINDMEESFVYTKKELKIRADSNSIQALSQILALTEGDMKAKCDKVAELFAAFKEHGSKFGTYLEFPALGTLLDVEVPSEVLVQEIIDGADFLKQSKGFGGLSMDKKTRLMFAALLAGNAYSNGRNSSDAIATNNAIITNNAIAMAIAEEVAIMVIMMCASTANSN